MPFVFRDWSEEQAQAFLVEYRAGTGGRFEDFVDAVRAGGGPVDAVSALDSDRLVDGWSWFVETYCRDEPLTPITDAGFEFEPPFWLTPIDWYCVGREGVYVTSGIAAWILELLKQRFDFYPLQLDTDLSFGGANYPKVPTGGLVDQWIGGKARKASYDERLRLRAEVRHMRPDRRPLYRRPEILLEYYQQVEAACEELLAKGPFVEVLPPEVLVMSAPVVNVGEDYLEEGEVEIEFDEIIDRHRRARFEELLRESRLLRGVRSADDREAMYVTIHGGVEDFQAEVARLWKLSASG